MAEDKRIVAGARCTWWGSISEIKTRNGIPCCPHCLNVLLEFDSQEKWDESVKRHEDNGNPGYKAMVDWGRGKCFPNYEVLKFRYKCEKMQ